MIKEVAMGMAARGIGGAVTLAASAALALTACSSSNSSTPPSGHSSPASTSSAPTTTAPTATKPNSCNMITISEASQALGGQTVKAPVRGHATVEGGVACVYYGPDVPAGTSPNVPVADSVRVVLVVGPKAKKYFDNYRKTVHAQAISGLGNEAYYDGYASISVLKGDAYLRIAVAVANPLPPEEVLARDALPRM